MANYRTFFSAFLLFCLIADFPASAADQPLPRVGRISAADGAVSVRPAGGEWSDSEINYPLASGTSVRTPAQGRAVLRVGAETIALAPATEIDLAELDTAGTQIVVRQGRVAVRLSQLDPARSIEIDIPKGGVWLLTPGDYEIAAGGDAAAARLGVFDGRARFVGKGLDTVVATGSADILSGNAPVTETLDAAKADDFTAWWRPLAGAADPQALRYVSAEMTGYDSLDTSGAWKVVEPYGAVWLPKDAPEDWSPYRNGHWRWIAPAGWTWIDERPWAFAPSHYGRWARIADPADGSRQRWAWVPTALGNHPVYASAVVAFLGTAGVGLSCPDPIGPAVAWFPLAPGEIYWPGQWTGQSGDADMVRRLNAGSVSDLSSLAAATDSVPPDAVINGDYKYRRFASVVPRASFLAGKPVASELVQLPDRRLDNAPLLAGSPQLSPQAPRVAVASSAPAARLAGAVQTLARILAPRQVSSVRTAVLGRAIAERGRVAIAAPRSRLIVVSARSNPRGRLHLASIAIHRR